MHVKAAAWVSDEKLGDFSGDQRDCARSDGRDGESASTLRPNAAIRAGSGSPRTIDAHASPIAAAVWMP